jgi:hypothetical protein
VDKDNGRRQRVWLFISLPLCWHSTHLFVSATASIQSTHQAVLSYCSNAREPTTPPSVTEHMASVFGKVTNAHKQVQGLLPRHQQQTIQCLVFHAFLQAQGMTVKTLSYRRFSAPSTMPVSVPIPVPAPESVSVTVILARQSSCKRCLGAIATIHSTSTVWRRRASVDSFYA